MGEGGEEEEGRGRRGREEKGGDEGVTMRNGSKRRNAANREVKHAVLK